MRTTITLKDIPVTLDLIQTRYLSNGRIKIVALDDIGAPFGVLTIDYERGMEQTEIVVKEYSENSSWVPQVLANLPEHFIDTGRTAKCGLHDCRVFNLVNWE